MTLFVVVATAHEAVISQVTERRAALVPSELRARGFAELGGEEVALSVFRVGPTDTLTDAITHIEALDLDAASGLILLTDERLPGLVELLGDVFSVSRFTPPGHQDDVGSIVGAILGKALRAHYLLKTRFDDLKYQQILRLPLRNFEAPEIDQMRTVCRDIMNQPDFRSTLDQVLARLRKRRRPKKVSKSPRNYLVDDDGKYFELGHKRHAQAETAQPPHNQLCVLGIDFRFGRRFDKGRHFNVSRDRNAILKGDFPDCHDVRRRAARGADHLNMFSNDFF